VNRLLERYFPEIARRSKEAEQWWRNAVQDDGTGPFCLLFGNFFAATVNVTMKGQLADMVVIPHADVKNVAAGVCGLFVFGEPSY
jgi:hypothetical protein